MASRDPADISYLSRRSSSFVDELCERIQRRHSIAWVHGAFPVVMARPWRHFLADLSGGREFIPGEPLIAAAIGRELWLYLSDDEMSIGALFGVFGAARITSIDRVDLPMFRVSGRPVQLGVEWFDEARMALAKMRNA